MAALVCESIYCKLHCCYYSIIQRLKSIPNRGFVADVNHTLFVVNETFKLYLLLYLYRGSSKMEEACDMYVRAANMYKMAKNWCGTNIFLF